MRFIRYFVAVMILGSAGAQAQAPLRILSGYPPGGAVDTLSRVFGEKLSEALGRPVVVETRAGAAGQIASEALRNSAPDGATLMIAPDSSITLYPHTVKKPAFDTLNDFVPVAHVGSYPVGFGVGALVPAADLRAYVSWAKSDPKNFFTPESLKNYLGPAAGEFFGQGIGQMQLGGLRAIQAGDELIAQPHQFVNFGDDTMLFSLRAYWY